MLYSIAEVSELINLSKVTLYKKLRLLDMSTHITKKSNITYIDDEGLQLIKDDLISLNSEDNITTSNEETEALEGGLSLKEDYIKYLKAENEKLWNGMQEKDDQISKLIDLNKNSQILLKEKPHDDILLLEEHFEEMDNKLIDIKEKMLERKELNDKKGFFNKIFRGKD